MSYLEKRLENFRGVLRSKDLDAIVLASYKGQGPEDGNYNFFYLTNLLRRFPTNFLILTEKECAVWVEESDLQRARERSAVSSVMPMERPERNTHTPDEFGSVVKKHIKELVGKSDIRVGLDGRYLQAATVPSMIGDGLSLVEVGQELEESRLIKDDQELSALKRAARATDKAVKAVMDEVHEGSTELELAALSEYAMRREGAECFWWKTLVNSGPDAAKWADCPTSRRITKGDTVAVDYTPVCDGYAADIGRTFVFGEPGPEQRAVLELTRTALDEGISALRDGATLGDVVEASMKAVRGSPYEKYYLGPGHFIGLYADVYPGFFFSVAKFPLIPKAYLAKTFRRGMTVAMEVVFGVPGVGRVCYEDDYLVGSNGAEKITHGETTYSFYR